MRQKNGKRIRSMTVVTLAVCLFALILWGLSMLILTTFAVQDYDQLLTVNGSEFGGLVASGGIPDSTLTEQNMLDGRLEYYMLRSIQRTNFQSLSASGWHTKSSDALSNDSFPVQTAVIFCGSDGTILCQSGNFVFFEYACEIEQMGQEPGGCAWIDLDRDGTGSALYTSLREMYDSGVHFSYARITGCQDGAEMIPIQIDYVTYQMLRHAQNLYKDEHGAAPDSLSELEREGLLKWKTVFDHHDGVKAGSTPVTVYTDALNFNFYDTRAAVSYRENIYDDLLALLSANTREVRASPALSGKYDWNGTILFDCQTFYVRSDPTSDLQPLTMLTAVSGHPRQAAVQKLIPAYLVTFALPVLCALILLHIIKRNLVEPVKAINTSISDDLDTIYFAEELLPKWRELYELNQNYGNTQQALHQKKDEVTRLSTALNYAKTAEQNRRQMMSNIAHELKTPLAVIHSYAEGLKENIAENKREKYLDVILAETEHLDRMVLELLDLSRLEAGRVKLNRSDFSLSELARSVFDRLEMSANAKGLNITYCFPAHCTVTADESRIRQVIENFATNAVKYTPVNGSIRAKIISNRFGTVFSIENDCEPLSPEALQKVWDTFYRADESRSGEGTGLGLSIAKHIVELHGGTCSVQNTSSGVRFQFSIL